MFFVPVVWYLTRFPAAAGIFVSDVFIVSRSGASFFTTPFFRMREEAARLRLAEAAGYRTGESASVAGAENFAEKR